MAFTTVLNGEEVLQIYGSAELITVSQILDFIIANGAGGGYTIQQFINSGISSRVAQPSTFVGWNSSSIGAKTQPIPASTGTLLLITITDLIGTAGTYPITAVPASGSIIGVNQVYTNNGSITLLDTAIGWVSV